ncbi:E2F/DP family winged-helix DNA-binding domain-containing protein [Giardia duodenalis]|uniref:E2F/DP family winged-helix DNA-binding domain-containing protein n=1 Tax=Giardia intestinalis (strain ATCC 50803 / WB clone C6) TaxID=184922 RepID=A8BH10_GIAIC|nr:E2F/DP family winged-helix DNA-binding domain-containing protein [Giardia intestinalis]KAE8301954.1 E2F/DP family winged-helix DNA-binding domain-containing protein [Giardia intestinalis]|eukprot:XP_001707025.1 Hypothetical protein GL50803_11383 [Giardia lamblia ATCC 50803]
MSEREGFLASITLNIRAVMYEAGALQQVELESEVLRRLGLYEDTAKHATVKRRIYDALSTFIALEIIQKVNKMLYWNGFPHYGPKPDLPGSGSAEVQSKLDSSAIVTEDSSRTLNSETNEHDPVAAGMDAIVPTAAEEGDDNASVEELEAQIAELEGRISVLSQQHAYYTFFNSQALLSPQWDQGAPPVPPPVALPFTVIAVPSEADAVIFSNQNHTRISIDASMQNITILSDDQIVQALIQNTDKSMKPPSPF